MIKEARKYHKWLMACIGIQFLIWSISGVYMVSMEIHHIHGESLSHANDSTIMHEQVTYPMTLLFDRYPAANNVSLVNILNKPVYRFTNHQNVAVMLDATTGEKLPPIDVLNAQRIAQASYAGEERIKRVQLIQTVDNLPAELSPRHLPVWQITFDKFANPTFYVKRQTGAIVAKRHDYWRLFDWMWRFHIMDYDDGENVANWLLFVVASLGLLSALFGMLLTYHHVIRRTSKKHRTSQELKERKANAPI